MRQTYQKNLIALAIRQLNHPTAEDVYDFIVKQHPTISRATVYRNLGKLSDKGDIQRICVPQGPDHFDYQTHNHYHFHCEKCHQLLDMDMPYQNELNCFNSDDDFIVKNHSLTFHGICKKCHPSNHQKGIKK